MLCARVYCEDEEYYGFWENYFDMKTNYKAIRNSVDDNDLFLKKAAEYTYIRNKWEFMSREEKLEADQGRSLTHDSFMTSLKILARIAAKENIDNSWYDELGEERKRIGDFACFVSYITGISNR